MLKNLEKSMGEVASLRRYAPSPKVNRIMSLLVQEVILAGKEQPSINSTAVRNKSAKAETAMEFWWAKKVIASREPNNALLAFPYTDNYRELVAREVSLITASGWKVSNGSRALIIGSGPLPLTALELQSQTKIAHIDQVDSSWRAVRIARRFLRSVGSAQTVLHARGESVKLRHTYDIIYIAALAGETEVTKQAIITAVLPNLHTNGRIVVRSAHGAREVLYPAMRPRGFKGVTLVKEYHPHDDVINSVLLYKKEMI